MTYYELLNEMTAILKAASITDFDKDAWRLFEELTGINKGRYFSVKDETPENAQTVEMLLNAVQRRAEGVPLQYITGEQVFMDLTLKVSSDTLIPRFDTEILAEMVRNEAEGLSVLDLCTGTGCIALSVAKGKKAKFVVGTDLSVGAVELAKNNAVLNGIALKEKDEIAKYPPVFFYSGDLFEALTGTEFEKEEFDIIVSNPPYIPTKDIAKLDREVKDFEPMSALDGHEDGLFFYRKITEEAKEHLAEGGRIYYEIGFNQGIFVADILKSEGFDDIEVIKDYAGLDRIVRAKRKDF